MCEALLYLGEVAERYQLHSRQIKTRVERGTFPAPIRDADGCRRWPVAVLDKFDAQAVRS